MLKSMVMQHSVSKAGRPFGTARPKPVIISDSSPAPVRSYFTIDQMDALLRAFWRGDLAKWDNEDKLPSLISVDMRYLLSQQSSTGKSLVQLSTHERVAQMLAELQSQVVGIKGVSYPGWYWYVLRVKLGFDDDMAESNQDKPAITKRMQVNAYAALADLIRAHIIEPDNGN